MISASPQKAPICLACGIVWLASLATGWAEEPHPLPDVRETLKGTSELLRQMGEKRLEVRANFTALELILGNEQPWKDLLTSVSPEERFQVILGGLGTCSRVRDLRKAETILAPLKDPLEKSWALSTLAIGRAYSGDAAGGKVAVAAAAKDLEAAIDASGKELDEIRRRKIAGYGGQVAYAFLTVDDDLEARRIQQLAKTEYPPIQLESAYTSFMAGNWLRFEEKLNSLATKEKCDVLYRIWLNLDDVPMSAQVRSKLLGLTEKVAKEAAPLLESGGRIPGSGLSLTLPQIKAMAYVANHDWTRALAEAEQPGWMGEQPPSVWDSLLAFQAEAGDSKALRHSRDAVKQKLAASRDPREQRYFRNLVVGLDLALGDVESGVAADRELGESRVNRVRTLLLGAAANPASARAMIKLGMRLDHLALVKAWLRQGRHQEIRELLNLVDDPSLKISANLLLIEYQLRSQSSAASR